MNTALENFVLRDVLCESFSSIARNLFIQKFTRSCEVPQTAIDPYSLRLLERRNRPNCIKFLFVSIMSLSFVASHLDVAKAAEASANTLVYDLSKTNQRIDGFGTHIWAGNEAGIAELQALQFRYIRITKDSDSWERLRDLRKETDRLNIRWIYNLWSAPRKFLDGKMLGDVSGFAHYWTNLVSELDRQGIRPHYIDLMNEPDSKGEWSTGISPSDLNRLIKETRSLLDAAGYSDVGIVGPGLSSFGWSDTPKYMNALDRGAVNALAAWANHTWDDGTSCHGGASCLESLWKNYGDIANRKAPEKPIWITEYATKEFTFHGVDYPNPDENENYSSAHSMAYAVRVYENTLALLNLGANALIYWSAQDSGKSWGYVDLAGRQKPVYWALKSLLTKLPSGTQVVQPPDQSESNIYSGTFIHHDRVVLAVANDGTTEQTVTILLENAARSYEIQSAECCTIDQPGDPTAGESDVAKLVNWKTELISMPSGTSQLTIALPADSTLTVELKEQP